MEQQLATEASKWALQYLLISTKQQHKVILVLFELFNPN